MYVCAVCVCVCACVRVYVGGILKISIFRSFGKVRLVYSLMLWIKNFLSRMVSSILGDSHLMKPKIQLTFSYVWFYFWPS